MILPRELQDLFRTNPYTPHLDEAVILARSVALAVIKTTAPGREQDAAIMALRECLLWSAAASRRPTALVTPQRVG